MRTKSSFIYNSIEYLAWFLVFMLIESFANTRVGEVIGGEKVELFYGIFILFTATGFLLFGAIGRIATKSKLMGILPTILGMIAVALLGCVNVSAVVIVGAACLLLIMGYLGEKLMYMLAISYSEVKYQGTILGLSMAASILLQFVMQSLITTRVASVISFEVILSVLLVFEAMSTSSLPIVDNGEEATNSEFKNIWVYVLATVLMTVILSLNDAYLVDLSAHTDTVNLFSWVRLFYCLSLVVAGVIYDFKNAAYFNIFVACAIMLSTVAYVFMGNTTDFNMDMSIMYFYCGFYVMFLTIHFIRIAGEESKTASALQFFIPGWGRVARCIITSVVTFVMLLLGNEVPVQVMIFVSCVLSMILVLLLAANDILIVREKSRIIDESLAVPEKTEEINLQQDFLEGFVEKYEFTDRECDVLEKLIHTESNLQEISDELFISKRVIQRHITSIYEKTNRSTRIGLLQLYVEFIREKSKKN